MVERGWPPSFAGVFTAVRGRVLVIQSLVPIETPMKKPLFYAAVAALLVFLPCPSALAQAAPAPAPKPINPPAPSRPLTVLQVLQQHIAAVIAQPRYKAAFWGVKVVSLDTHQVLFQQNADKLFVPASNTKLFTTALALDRLGPDYQIRTSLFAKAKPTSRGTVKGDLVIYGRGDPTFNARMNGGNIYAALEPLASALAQAGVKRISGDLVADESYFRGPPFGSDWSWNDLEYAYAAEVSALTINDNAIELIVKSGDRVGMPAQAGLGLPTSYLAISNFTQTVASKTNSGISFYRPVGENIVYVTGTVPVGDSTSSEAVAVHQPAGLFGALFKDLLVAHGIAVSGRVRVVNWLDRQTQPVDLREWIEIAGVDSPRLRDIAREVNKTSNNLYADLLLANVGTVLQGEKPFAPDDTSESLGITAMRAFLGEAGVAQGEAELNEGSGLSNGDLVTPNATVTLLDYMSRHKSAADYLNTLPVAGADGTLRMRMRNTAAAGVVHAKTGTSTWADSLSGYVIPASGERLAFCLMLNRYHAAEPAHAKAADLDAIAAMLAGYAGRPAAR
jgi:D-alanyl-D-alanine carboxypeptidase/D-alanyl-D-alanine-endopeptidase (penicillin-binding protein 4)